MAVLSILSYPDPRLHKVAQAVQVFDERLECLTRDMLETMYAAQGVGLAATQVDVHQRVVVIDVSEERNQPLVLINPEIIWASEERVLGEEGCLSVPGIYDEVPRATEVRLKAQNLKGESFEVNAQGFLAVCMQHELDHLQGKVFVQHLSFFKQSRIKTKLNKRQRREGS